MHKKDILLLRIGVTVGPVARKHHLTPEELLTYLQQLFPAMDAGDLLRAAAIGAKPL